MGGKGKGKGKGFPGRASNATGGRGVLPARGEPTPPRRPPMVFRTSKRRAAITIDGIAYRHAMAVGASLDFRIKQVLTSIDDSDSSSDDELAADGAADVDDQRKVPPKSTWKAAVGLMGLGLLSKLSDSKPKGSSARDLIKRGFMKKAGHSTLVSTGMKRRYFELTKCKSKSLLDFALEYFTDQTKSVQKGSIALRGSTLIENEAPIPTFFSVQEGPDRTARKYTMECESMDEKRSWIEALSSAIAEMAKAKEADALAEKERGKKVAAENEEKERNIMRNEELVGRQARKAELAQPCALEGCEKIERFDHDDKYCTWHRRRFALSMAEDSWCKACGIGSKVDFKINKRRLTYSTSMSEATHSYSDTDSGSGEDESDDDDLTPIDSEHAGLWKAALKNREEHHGRKIQWAGGWVFKRGE
jgi:hypothetical protein